MNKLLAMCCCVMLVSSPMALAQDPAAKKKPPVSAKQEAEKKKALQNKMADCTKGAKSRNLEPGTQGFNRHMTECNNS